MSRAFKVGTRGSPLALAQTEEALARLRVARPDVAFETAVIKTHGDEDYRKDLGTPLDGKRAFTKRIEDALLAGRIDFAVHSLKDLPTDLADGLVIASIPPRGDPRDLFVANDGIQFDRLRAGTRVGTSSLRRRSQFLARWPGLQVVELHGNVGTRLRRLDAREFDAVVIAVAGLHRLNIRHEAAEPLSPDVMTPAPGQGALALEARADDKATRELLEAVDDPLSRIATQAERALSARIGGSCNVPLGALATIDGDSMTLRAVVASPDGRNVVRTVASGPSGKWPRVVDDSVADLVDRGARDLLRRVA